MINHIGRPKIIDRSLTHIFKMWQWVWYFPLSLQQWPILWLYLTMTKWLCNYLTHKPKNHWRSVDTHCPGGAGCISLFLFHIKVANTLIIYNNDLITLWLPGLEDHTLMMLHWGSFKEDSTNVVASVSAPKYGHYYHYALATKSLIHYETYKTTNHSCSVDTDFRLGLRAHQQKLNFLH